MKLVILGGGPAGLYCGLLVKKANPTHDVTIIERNPADVTYGWGVVFSDRTLASFQRADYKTYQQITDKFVIWDAIDVHYRGETVMCAGHVIASIARVRLLNILQSRCIELGVKIKFGTEVSDLSELPKHDLLVAADGINSFVRRAYEAHFKPSIEMGKARYIWLGADKVLDAFNFIFHENEHGLFQVHAYPFSGTTSTYIIECDEESWLNAGLDRATEEESLAYCQRLLAEDLAGVSLISNNSKWTSFPTLKTKNWHTEIQNQVVLLGDAAHTAHFSIGAGTKLAMEDAIALATSLDQHSDIGAALNEYELERKPVVETFQRAASESQAYFETIKRYLGLPPMQFTFQLLTRSGRISYDDLHFRDTRFGDSVDRFAATTHQSGHPDLLFAPPPLFAPLHVRGLILSNRMVSRSYCECGAVDGLITSTCEDLPAGVGLVLTGICAVSAEARITPECVGMYTSEHREAWHCVVEAAHEGGSRACIQLGHAGRRGSVRPRRNGLDRPLREGAWDLISASALPFIPHSRQPKEMDRADMDQVKDAFVRAAHMSDEAGFDMIQVHMAHGYLLASFLSPLTNVRSDDYGGGTKERARYPLEVFDGVREAWPSNKPISVALQASDYAPGGMSVEDAVVFARLLKEHGCDLVEVLAGQMTPRSELPYRKGFLTPLSERIRNGAGIATMVGGYLTTSNEANTILAAGRADLCIMTEL